MLKNQVLYSKPSGSQILFDEEKDGVIYAHVRANGIDYESRSLVGIISKGYWNEVYISSDINTTEKHLAGQHDQKTHGLWATGTPQGGNGLSHREILDLQKNSSDPKKKAVYNAEGKNNPVNEPGPKPQIAERGFFASQAEYDKAYKEYSKKFTDWAREFHRNIQSPTGEKHLNGKPKGVEDYVLAVTTSKWFVEAFGNGGRLGIPPVKVQSLANANGTYMVGIKNGQGVSALTIDSYSTRNEPTILHEIAHYATATSARENYEPHGVEFMKNFLYIGSKVIGDDWAAKLAKSYREEGIDLGN